MEDDEEGGVEGVGDAGRKGVLSGVGTLLMQVFPHCSHGTFRQGLSDDG